MPSPNPMELSARETPVRKPIAISVTHQDGVQYPIVHVICDDGSIWSDEVFHNIPSRSWRRLPDIPQDLPETPHG